MTDALGEGQVISYLVELSKKGYQFDILSFEKPDKFRKLEGHIRGILQQSNIGWNPQIFHSFPPVISKAYDKLSLLIAAKKMYRQHKYDLIHCRSYMSAEVGLELKKKYGVKFLFDMRGFWADEKADGGAWDRSKWFWNKIYLFYKKKEKEFLQNADHIISLTATGKKEMMTWSFFDPKIPITVIPCCVNLEHFALTDQDKRTKARKLLGIENNIFVLSYLGSLGSWYMIDEMLLLFKSILVKKPDALFLIITTSNFEYVNSRLTEMKIPSEKVILRSVPFSDVPGLMYASNCSVSFIKPLYSKISSSPIKIGEILSMGIPLIANSIGDTTQLMSEENAGVLIQNFSQKEYEDAALSISALILIPPSSLRSLAEKYFDLKIGVEQYSNIYHQIFK